MSTTVGDLIDQAIVRADMENSNFVNAAVWLTWFFDSYAELYDLLVGKFEDYYLSSADQSVTSPNDYLTLPTDFYKLRGLDKSDGSAWENVRSFNFDERNSLDPAGDVRYRIAGGKLLLYPLTKASGAYRIWYVPRPARFTARADTVTGIDGWEVYIVTDLAIKAILKEEGDIGPMMALKGDIRRRIEEMAANRDAGAPQQIADVTRLDINYRYGY